MDLPARLVAAAALGLLVAALGVAAEEEKPIPQEVLTPGGSAESSEGEPLTNVTIVRMVASGMTEEKILARIAAAPARFDVAPDILDELRLAGVPRAVIEAMVAKAREGEPAVAAPPAAEKPSGWIEIVFQDDPKLAPEANSFTIPEKVIDPNLGPPPKKVEVALFLICRHSTHVPDHWHALTPLNQELGRHEVLFFHAESAPATGQKGEKLVFLPHPPRWRFAADAGSHVGAIGVAARAEGDEKYKPMETAEIKSLLVQDGLLTRLAVRLRTRMGRAVGGRREADETMELTHLGTVGRRRGHISTTIVVVSVSDPEDPSPPLP